MKQTAQWLVVIGLFQDRYVELFLLLSAVFLLIAQCHCIYKSRILLYLVPVWMISLTATWLVGYEFEKPIQQIVIVTSFLLLYEQFFLSNRLNLLALFRKYIYLSYIICLIGLFQELIFMATGTNVMRLLPTYHSTQIINVFLMRITSTLNEGGCLGIAMMPALVYLFIYKDPYHLLGIRKWLMLLVSLLTLSPFVYIFCVVAFFYHLNRVFGRYKMITGVMVVVILFAGVAIINPFGERYKSDNGIWNRINDSYSAVSNMGNARLNNIVSYRRNTSSMVLATNLYIALHAPSRLFGTGIGTHAQSHAMLVHAKYRKSELDFNVDDGYSLFNRLFSEFGIIGLLLYVVFLIRFFNKDNMINICLFCMLICLFLRGGNYVLYGTVFAHFFYYYTARYKLSVR